MIVSPHLNRSLLLLGQSGSVVYVWQNACIALEELWTLAILPDIRVDPSITLSQAARSILLEIASGFTQEERLLLCCTSRIFDSKNSWDFYYHAFGDKDTMS